MRIASFVPGVGPIGALTLLAARAAGAAVIFVSEPNAYRRNLAKQLVPDAILIDPASEDVALFIKERTEEGVGVAKAIWHDMLAFDGYEAHELIQDLDEPGHLIVVSRWASRAAADAAMSYTTHPNAMRADALVSRPRRRTVGALL